MINGIKMIINIQKKSMIKYKFLFLLLLLSSSVLSQKIERIEPPFWWAGMNDSSLQILLYGPKINQYEVEVSKVRLLNVRKTENPNYLFILVDTKGVAPGNFDLFLKKRNKIKKHIKYQLKERKKNSVQRKGFDSSDVIYLLMPDRFANGNPDNDSTPFTLEKSNRNSPDGRHGGDIQGIINHLDYLKDLGVTSIWSTPLLEDNEPKYSYHTYAQSDYYKIDPRYGTNEDYKKLADELHKRKMKLVMDYVTNHWGSKHWMILDLPTHDWIHYWDKEKKGFKRSNYRMSTQFDPHTSIRDKKLCVGGWFDTSMPDMNLNNPLLLKYMTQNAIWWIEFAGLDGLRVDTYSYNDKEGIAKWTKAIMNEYPHFNIVGEVWMHDQAQISYWQKDSKIAQIQDYNSGLPAVMDFTLHDAVTQMFNEDQQGWFTGMIKAYDNFVNDFLYPDINNIMVFAGNHDVSRINSILKNDLNKYKLALSLILTTRGIPQLYYGDEIGMTGDKSKGDGNIRKDFPGGWPNDSNNAFIKEGRTKKQQAYFDFTRKILNWRKKTPVIHHGKMLQYIPVNNVYVFFRKDDKNSVMIVLNNSSESQILDFSLYREGIGAFRKAEDIITNKKIDLSKKLKIAPKTPLILELQ